jgi:hypothetical protein
MFATLIVYCIAQAITALALPISVPAIVTRRAPPNNCNDINECRTLWDIIWSCLATIFACTWIAVHLNIPGPDESSLRIATRKLGIMVLAIIAPELVVVWAMRQWLVARRIAKGVYHRLSEIFATDGDFNTSW